MINSYPKLFAFGFACLLIGCSSPLVQKGEFAPNQPKYSIEVDKAGHKQGKEIWWYSSGVKKYEATNNFGIRDGKFSAWYSDGTKWYEGFEYHGKPESTLTYWNSNGLVKSTALFRDGIQLERQDFDDEGHPKEMHGIATLERFPTLQGDEESEAEDVRHRKAGLQIWATRVRQTVESFWVLPKQFEKERPYRSVAKIKVNRDGRILGVIWSEKSPSQTFNNLANQTFKRIKRLPAFPPQIQEQTLDVQYEFISLGKQSPRRKLEVLEPDQQAPPPP